VLKKKADENTRPTRPNEGEGAMLLRGLWTVNSAHTGNIVKETTEKLLNKVDTK